MAAAGEYHDLRSSLPLQILLLCNIWYFILFALSEFGLFAYKGLLYPYLYGNGAMAAEVILIFILAGLEAVRLFLGWKGNLTERIVTLVCLLVFSAASAIGTIYLLIWQTLVLRADVVLCSIQLSLIGLEFLFGTVAIIKFIIR